MDTQVAATAWFGALNEVVTRWLLSGTPDRLQDAYDALRPLLIRSVGVAERDNRPGFDEALRSRLRSVLLRGVEQAQVSGERVLACASVECPPFDPIAVFRRAAPATSIVWLQPSAAFGAVAAGEATAVALAGAGRFEDARREWKRIQDASVVDAGTAPLEAPACFTSFAFAAKAAAGDAACSRRSAFGPRTAVDAS